MKYKDEALANDTRLYLVANYYESKGGLFPAQPNDVHERFSEFKVRIQKGSFTIEQLEEKVYFQFGITSAPPPVSPVSPLAPDILEEIEKIDQEYQEHQEHQEHNNNEEDSQKN